jgi:UDP-GlcNAc3NAcA epimerase
MPEEINRVLTDHAADLLLAPTETAVANLRREGLPASAIRLVGDVMFDVALFYARQAERRSKILKELRVAPKSYILATIHRAENTDNDARLRAIFAGLGQIARDIPVVMPLHPRTRGALVNSGLLEEAERSLRLIDPVGYLDMIQLERQARLVATDSGGVQKEAFFYEVPCVTLRDQTEWVETVELGLNRLVSPIAAEAVAAGIRQSLAPAKRGPLPEVFGGGKAAEAIARELLSGCPTFEMASAA